MRCRPVIARAQRSAARFASVAVCVICQNGRPNNFASFSPTRATRSAGSIEVMPMAPVSASARAIAGGE